MIFRFSYYPPGCVFYLFGSSPLAYPWKLVLIGPFWACYYCSICFISKPFATCVQISWAILRSLFRLMHLLNSGFIFLSTSGYLYLHISRLIKGKAKLKSSMTPSFKVTSLFLPLSKLLQNMLVSTAELCQLTVTAHTHMHAHRSFC